MNQVVRGLTEMLERTLGEHISIETVLVDDPWPVAADGARLETAIVNLAINARDAMPSGGKLTFSTANVTIDAGVQAVLQGKPRR